MNQETRNISKISSDAANCLDSIDITDIENSTEFEGILATIKNLSEGSSQKKFVKVMPTHITNLIIYGNSEEALPQISKFVHENESFLTLLLNKKQNLLSTAEPEKERLDSGSNNKFSNFINELKERSATNQRF